jgi:hypothetical protein
MPGVRDWAERRFKSALGEVDKITEAAEGPADDDEESVLAPVFGPDGKPRPRFKAFVADVARSAPSARYRRDPSYGPRQYWEPETSRRARDNYRRWQERHARATTEVTAWLASNGLLGDEARAAFRARTGAERMRHQAEANLAAARARADQARAAVAEGVRRALAGESDLPAGGPVVCARLDVEAAELVAEEVRAAGPGLNRAWGDSLARADWKQALARAELLDEPEADAATAWLRAKVSPPVDAGKDPLGWI